MRTLQSGVLALFLFFSTQAMADEAVANEEVAVVLTRSDHLPHTVHTATDPYFEGYIQALIDIHYAEYGVTVFVKDHTIWLVDLPRNKLIANSIIAFVKDIPGVCGVEVVEDLTPAEERYQEKHVERPATTGIWFPQMTELFQPMIADPRQMNYTVGYRSGDHVIGNKTAAFSFGDDFAVYRWLDLFWGGDMQIGVEAGIWCVFNMDPHPDIAGGTELVNTDYYVAIPITYAAGNWSFRLRGYHISGHLGDEFLINHPGFKRVNPSIEAIDLCASYQISEGIRLYAYPGVYVHSDPSYKWKPLYIEYGTEARFLGHKFYSQKLYGTCFIALHFRNLEQLDYNFDGTYRAGYEFSKLQGIGRKFRFYIGYHHGYSLEGQFAKERTKYFEYNISYGF